MSQNKRKRPIRHRRRAAVAAAAEETIQPSPTLMEETNDVITPVSAASLIDIPSEMIDGAVSSSPTPLSSLTTSSSTSSSARSSSEPDVMSEALSSDELVSSSNSPVSLAPAMVQSSTSESPVGGQRSSSTNPEAESPPHMTHTQRHSPLGLSTPYLFSLEHPTVVYDDETDLSSTMIPKNDAVRVPRTSLAQSQLESIPSMSSLTHNTTSRSTRSHPDPISAAAAAALASTATSSSASFVQPRRPPPVRLSMLSSFNEQRARPIPIRQQRRRHILSTIPIDQPTEEESDPSESMTDVSSHDDEAGDEEEEVEDEDDDPLQALSELAEESERRKRRRLSHRPASTLNQDAQIHTRSSSRRAPPIVISTDTSHIRPSIGGSSLCLSRRNPNLSTRLMKKLMKRGYEDEPAKPSSSSSSTASNDSVVQPQPRSLSNLVPPPNHMITSIRRVHIHDVHVGCGDKPCDLINNSIQIITTKPIPHYTPAAAATSSTAAEASSSVSSSSVATSTSPISYPSIPYNYLRTRPEFETTTQMIGIIKHLYGLSDEEYGHHTYGHSCVSKEEVQAAALGHHDLLYGEVLPIGATKLFDSAHLDLKSARTVCDLGSGLGKLAIQAFLQFPNLERVYGCELSVSRFQKGTDAIGKLFQQRFQFKQRCTKQRTNHAYTSNDAMDEDESMEEQKSGVTVNRILPATRLLPDLSLSFDPVATSTSALTQGRIPSIYYKETLHTHDRSSQPGQHLDPEWNLSAFHQWLVPPSKIVNNMPNSSMPHMNLAQVEETDTGEDEDEDEDEVVHISSSLNHTTSAATRAPSPPPMWPLSNPTRTLELHCRNLFDLPEAYQADVVICETKFSEDNYPALCQLVQRFKRGCKLLTYENLDYCFYKTYGPNPTTNKKHNNQDKPVDLQPQQPIRVKDPLGVGVSVSPSPGPNVVKPPVTRLLNSFGHQMILEHTSTHFAFEEVGYINIDKDMTLSPITSTTAVSPAASLSIHFPPMPQLVVSHDPTNSSALTTPKAAATSTATAPRQPVKRKRSNSTAMVETATEDNPRIVITPTRTNRDLSTNPPLAMDTTSPSAESQARANNLESNTRLTNPPQFSTITAPMELDDDTVRSPDLHPIIPTSEATPLLHLSSTSSHTSPLSGVIGASAPPSNSASSNSSSAVSTSSTSSSSYYPPHYLNPFQQMPINRSKQDRFYTTWATNLGHHFYLWVKA